MKIIRGKEKHREDVSFFGGGASGFFGPTGGAQIKHPRRDAPFRFNLLLYGRRKTDADT